MRLTPLSEEEPSEVPTHGKGIQAEGSVDVTLPVRDPSGKDQGFPHRGIAVGVAGVERNGPLKTRNGLVEFELALEDVCIRSVCLRGWMLQGLLQIRHELLGDVGQRYP